MKYFLLTLGCQMNKSDSERVSSVLEEMGYVEAETEDEANLLGVLACSVRQKSIDRVYSKIHKWNRAKNKRNLITFISGCVLPADRTKFMKLFDIVFQMAELPKLPEFIQHYGVTTGIIPNQHTYSKKSDKKIELCSTSLVADNKLLAPDSIKPFWNVKPTYHSGFEAFVPIQNGCDKFCTFCAVPYTRGREISRPSAEIIEEVENLIKKGYKSITLLGQNVNSYGKDKEGSEISFNQLLERIGELGLASGKEFWVYFTSPHPRDMSRDVIETIAKYQHLAKQIHLPLQSGNDKVLIKMNRNHSVARYAKIIEDIRELIPNATIFTDIIVGFSGETEAQFNDTVEAFHLFKFNMAYIAVYSPRPGATAYSWDDNVPQAIKKKRLHVLTEEMKKYTRHYNSELIGTTQKVLVTTYNASNKTLAGLTEGKINIVIPSNQEKLVGTFIYASIQESTDFSLKGHYVKQEADYVQ
jgi:tRNA-2-methylthio-N6-dimethylallyladenosine synthase